MPAAPAIEAVGAINSNFAALLAVGADRDSDAAVKAEAVRGFADLAAFMIGATVHKLSTITESHN